MLQCLRFKPHAQVRYNKIESGLRQVSGAITVKLNHLGAAECNVIRLLFKGTLDTFFEINKVGQCLTCDGPFCHLLHMDLTRC
jgi:hypothetical protein